MTCTIEHDQSSWIEDDLADAAQIFAAHADEALDHVPLNLVIGEEDDEGWIAYLYGESRHGEEIVAMMGRGTYHFDDVSLLDDGDVEILKELVEEFAAAMAGDGCAYEIDV